MAENSDDDLPLEVYWDAVRRTPSGDPDPTVLRFRDLAEPGDLIIGTSRDRVLVIIKPNGDLLFGPEYSPTEASQIFWEHMAQQRLVVEERLLIINHMEAILVQLGLRDMECERLRQAAADEQDPLQKAALIQSAELAMHRLSMVANQAIELGRGLVRRPEIPVPEVPPGVPPSIQRNPNTDYQGREGLPTDPDSPERLEIDRGGDR